MPNVFILSILLYAMRVVVLCAAIAVMSLTYWLFYTMAKKTLTRRSKARLDREVTITPAEYEKIFECISKPHDH